MPHGGTVPGENRCRDGAISFVASLGLLVRWGLFEASPCVGFPALALAVAGLVHLTRAARGAVPSWRRHTVAFALLRSPFVLLVLLSTPDDRRAAIAVDLAAIVSTGVVFLCVADFSSQRGWSE